MNAAVDLQCLERGELLKGPRLYVTNVICVELPTRRKDLQQRHVKEFTRHLQVGEDGKVLQIHRSDELNIVEAHITDGREREGEMQ